MWNTDEAIEFCALIEETVEACGGHVALTGGCLYKEPEDRKDVDILIYRHKKDTPVALAKLWEGLEGIGIKKTHSYGRIVKATCSDGEQHIDLFFPEDENPIDDDAFEYGANAQEPPF